MQIVKIVPLIFQYSPMTATMDDSESKTVVDEGKEDEQRPKKSMRTSKKERSLTMRRKRPIRLQRRPKNPPRKNPPAKRNLVIENANTAEINLGIDLLKIVLPEERKIIKDPERTPMKILMRKRSES